ncbi:MAG TPA: hypothetical protein VFM07_01960, partial [Intrasporangium sp.]|nr:hypothetical protein [Intrasporangium sp.]
PAMTMTRFPAGVLAIGAVLALGACAGDAPVQLEESRGMTDSGISLPTQTRVVTLTETTISTVTPTVTVTVTSTGTALPTTPTIPAVFDEGAARAGAQTLLVDISLLDRDFPISATASPTLPASPQSSGRPTLLDARAAVNHLEAFDEHLGNLLAAGVPLGTDGPSYVARVLSLQTFTAAAIGETSTDPSRAAARYRVIRVEVGVLLNELGTSLGASFTLPPTAPAR